MFSFPGRVAEGLASAHVCFGGRLWRAVAVSAVFALAVLALAACGSRSGDALIVFASDRDGNLEIYSTDASGDNQINLTNTPENEFSPEVSPDRTLVAFQSGAVGGTTIDVMQLDGSARTTVSLAAGDHSSQRWSPSSRRLAFIAEQGGETSVFTAHADGSGASLLTPVSGDQVGDWSGDGDSVVFAVGGGPGMGIYIRNPDGVNEFRVTDTPDYSPIWSPDSNRIAFLSTRDGNAEIYVMNADGSQQTRITTNTARDIHPSW